jgi:hypothetical protein
MPDAFLLRHVRAFSSEVDTGSREENASNQMRRSSTRLIEFILSRSADTATRERWPGDAVRLLDSSCGSRRVTSRAMHGCATDSKLRENPRAALPQRGLLQPVPRRTFLQLLLIDSGVCLIRVLPKRASRVSNRYVLLIRDGNARPNDDRCKVSQIQQPADGGFKERGHVQRFSVQCVCALF